MSHTESAQINTLQIQSAVIGAEPSDQVYSDLLVGTFFGERDDFCLRWLGQALRSRDEDSHTETDEASHGPAFLACWRFRAQTESFSSGVTSARTTDSVAGPLLHCSLPQIRALLA